MSTINEQLKLQLIQLRELNHLSQRKQQLRQLRERTQLRQLQQGFVTGHFVDSNYLENRIPM